MTDDLIVDTVTAEERVVLDFYRSLTEEQKQAAWDLMQMIYAARRETAADG
jgi:hypothetical protein